MASTSSIGAQTSASASTAQEFYSSFNASLQGLKSKIEATNQISELEALVQELSKARNQLTEITSQLPTYDRQIHEQHFKEVSSSLSKKRAELKPSKNGFSFKRTAKVSSQKQPLVKAESNTTLENSFTESNFTQSTTSQQSAYLSLTDRNQEYLTLESISFPEKDGKSSQEASDLHLRNLEGCLIDLRTVSIGRQGASSSADTRKREKEQEDRKFKALQIRDLKKCLLLAGEIEGSVMIHGCEDSVIVLGCRQYRMHNSKSTLVFLKTSSMATIEDCSSLVFSHASSSILHLPSEISQSEEVTESESTLQVQDFNHISDSNPSPNWKFLQTRVRDECVQLLEETKSEGEKDERLNGKNVGKLLEIAGISTSTSST